MLLPTLRSPPRPEALADLVGDLVNQAGVGNGVLVRGRVGRLDLACLQQDLLGATSQAEHEHERALDHLKQALAFDPSFVLLDRPGLLPARRGTCNSGAKAAVG